MRSTQNIAKTCASKWEECVAIETGNPRTEILLTRRKWKGTVKTASMVKDIIPATLQTGQIQPVNEELIALTLKDLTGATGHIAKYLAGKRFHKSRTEFLMTRETACL
jgi:hypothetical protein